MPNYHHNVTGTAAPTWVTTTGHYTLPNSGGYNVSSTGAAPNIDISPEPALAQLVSVTADGMLLVDCGWFKAKVPPKLFKDLTTLAEMLMVERLAPEPIKR